MHVSVWIAEEVEQSCKLHITAFLLPHFIDGIALYWNNTVGKEEILKKVGFVLPKVCFLIPLEASTLSYLNVHRLILLYFMHPKVHHWTKHDYHKYDGFL